MKVSPRVHLSVHHRTSASLVTVPILRQLYLRRSLAIHKSPLPIHRAFRTFTPPLNYTELRNSSTGSKLAMSNKTTFYDLSAELPGGKTYDFSQLKGKVVLIVNTASQWCVTCFYRETQPGAYMVSLNGVAEDALNEPLLLMPFLPRLRSRI